METIKNAIRNLGAGRCKKGYYFTYTAIELLLEDEMRFLNLSRDVYPEVAKRYQVKASCVERNIRTMIEFCWYHGNREFFNDLAGYELDHRPTVGEFLDMLYSYFFRSTRP